MSDAVDRPASTIRGRAAHTPRRGMADAVNLLAIDIEAELRELAARRRPA